MRRPKILAVSYYYPPMVSAQTVPISRLLLSLDASVVVICGNDARERFDDGIASHEEGSLDRVIRIPFSRHNLWRYVDKIGYRCSFSWSNLIPDEQRRWINKAIKYFGEWRKDSGYAPDIVVTFGMPMSDHFFGMEIKKQTGVPWIAHFSDPWADNDMRFGRQNLIKRLNKRLEKKVITGADAVVFTSPETIDLVMRKYPSSWRNKSFYLPHCFDVGLNDDSLKPPDERYVIRYIGSLYHPRSPRPFFEAVETLAKEKPGLLEGVNIEFVGYIGVYENLPERYPLARRFIRFVGMVPYAESLRLMQTSNCLLVIDAPDDLSVFFPSKLVEYIGAKRFIMAVSPPGATNRIVKEVGGVVANPSDIKEIVNTLEHVLKQRPSALPLPADRYEKTNVAEEFMKVVKGVINGKENEQMLLEDHRVWRGRL